MMLNSDRELENTRVKLRQLQQMYAEASADSDSDVRDAELESLMRVMNQFKEEIA